MNTSLQALKSVGVKGIMMHVWWGLVEREAAGSYNWGGYTELLETAKKHGLKVQAIKGHRWLNLCWLGFFFLSLNFYGCWFFLFGIYD